MEKVTVTLPAVQYDIVIGAGVLNDLGDILTGLGYSGKCVLVTDATVRPLYGDGLQAKLESAGFEVLLIGIPVGEDKKSLDTAAGIYFSMTDFFAERTTPVIALGGGVVGDLAGFVAATYMRGVPLVQVPTTLLAQGDSSIGGKVAVNHGKLKNKIGSFYHPAVTVSDQETLRSLSERELSNGLSEIIKHGIILDAELFAYLEENMQSIRECDTPVLEKVVARSAAIKARIVEKDEFDLGLRNILNAGHTVGHAVETVSGLSVWHGEAVAIGVMAEARISLLLGLLSRNEVSRIEALLDAAGLPTRIPDLASEALLEAMKHDKKVKKGKLPFALPSRIGEVMVTDNVESSIIRKALEQGR